MQTIGLFEAKTHLSAYIARAEAGEEVIITRHNKPVAKLVPLDAKPAVVKVIPKFVQRTFNMGPLLIAETNMNRVLADLEVQDFLELNARLEREAKNPARPANEVS